jgi:hypothetical protein
MGNTFSGFRLSNGTAGGFTALQGRLQRWWQRLPAEARSPLWPALLAALLVLGMLLAFHQVVLGVVQQSELRHKASAMQAEATWRCRALPGLDASSNCLLQLNSTVHWESAVQVQSTQALRQSDAQYALKSKDD